MIGLLSMLMAAAAIVAVPSTAEAAGVATRSGFVKVAASQYGSQAVQMLTSKNWNGLASVCTQWTQAEPRNPDAWACMGTAQCRTGKPTATVNQSVQRAVALRPANPGPWEMVAACYNDQKNFAATVTAEQNAMHLAPRNWQSWYALGMAWENVGEATIIPQPGILLPSGDPSSFWLGAADGFEHAGQLGAPRSYSVWTYAGGANYHAGSYPQAIRDYLNALRENPADQYARSGMFQTTSGLERSCTRITPGLKVGNTQEFTKSWNCDPATTAILQQGKAAIH